LRNILYNQFTRQTHPKTFFLTEEFGQWCLVNADLLGLLFPTPQKSEDLIYIYLHGINDLSKQSSVQDVIVEEREGVSCKKGYLDTVCQFKCWSGQLSC